MNKFEEEIARLNKERDEKIAEINGAINDLEEANHKNNEKINQLVQKRSEARNERNRKVKEVMLQQDAYYLKHGSNVKLRRILHNFFEKYPEVLEKWKAYKAEAEGGEA